MNRTRRHSYFTCITSTFLTAILASTVIAGEVYKYKTKGQAASAYWYDGCTTTSVYVSENTTNKIKTTNLSYWVYDYCSGYYLGYGWGLIPNNDFNGSMAHGSLTTDTTNNPNFFNYYGTGGIIDIEWKKNSDYTSHSTGNYHTHYGSGLKYHTNSNYTSNSADADGTVLGHTVTDNFSSSADLRKNHSGDMRIQSSN